MFFHKVFTCNLGKTDSSGTKFLNVKLFYYDLTRLFYWVILINIGWSSWNNIFILLLLLPLMSVNGTQLRDHLHFPFSWWGATDDINMKLHWLRQMYADRHKYSDVNITTIFCLFDSCLSKLINRCFSLVWANKTDQLSFLAHIKHNMFVLCIIRNKFSSDSNTNKSFM